MHKRIKRKNFLEKLPIGSKLVARPSKWGNPYPVTEYGLEESLRLYKEWLSSQLRNNKLDLSELVGFDLVCYCDLYQSCHADILLKELQIYLDLKCKLEGHKVCNVQVICECSKCFKEMGYSENDRGVSVCDICLVCNRDTGGIGEIIDDHSELDHFVVDFCDSCIEKMNDETNKLLAYEEEHKLDKFAQDLEAWF